MRVPDQVRECVTFVGRPYVTPSGQQSVQFGGTAFIVTMPSKAFPDRYNYIYLVTAKHVAENIQGREFVVTLNDKNGKGGVIITAPAEHSRWWTHPTGGHVDVAVIPFKPPDITKPVAIPASMFLTDEAIQSTGLGTGDEVFITGLFVHLKDTEKNLPIVRMGNVAMMPDEPVPTHYGRTDAYLIEARSIGGLSGSPAFVYPWQGGKFYLMGLMHGHWDIPIEDRDAPLFQDEAENRGAVNMGIAIVVPAKKILEVLNHPELVARRDEADKRIEEEHKPSPDDTWASPSEVSEEEPGLTREQFEEALRKASRRITPEQSDGETS